MVTTSSGLRSVLAHVRAGRLKQGLKALDKLPPADDSVERDLRILTRAELLQATGENAQASEAVRHISTNSRLASAKARGELVLGQVSLEQDGPDQAIGHFQKALRLASEAQEMQLVCRSQAKLLTTIAEISEYTPVLALMREAERNIASYGDAQLAADLTRGWHRFKRRRVLFATLCSTSEQR